VTNRRRTPYGFDYVAEPSQLPGYSRQGLSAGCIDSMVAEGYRTYRLSTPDAMTRLHAANRGLEARNIISYISYANACGRYCISIITNRTWAAYCLLCASYLYRPSLTVVGKVGQKVPIHGLETRHVTGSAFNVSIKPNTTRRHSSRPRSPHGARDGRHCSVPARFAHCGPPRPL
jgi:hypothetical protein